MDIAQELLTSFNQLPPTQQLDTAFGILGVSIASILTAVGTLAFNQLRFRNKDGEIKNLEARVRHLTTQRDLLLSHSQALSGTQALEKCANSYEKGRVTEGATILRDFLAAKDLALARVIASYADLQATISGSNMDQLRVLADAASILNPNLKGIDDLTAKLAWRDDVPEVEKVSFHSLEELEEFLSDGKAT